MMTSDERVQHDLDFFAKCIEITRKAAAEYADPQNNFANFEDAIQFGLTKEQDLGAFLHKHLRGIGNYLGGVTQQRDSIEGRLIDAVNYLVILHAMIEQGLPLPTKEEFQEYVQAVGQIVKDVDAPLATANTFRIVAGVGKVIDTEKGYPAE